ncbi:MAG: OmpH family outer membrane protein [Planctomycetes bacterium]|nr:OmpH family outer membrane protein [Planctomycetota bacterium]MBI3844337.1 OmpH family outer membrane protein [Planctomycetota bacterium]
MIRNLRSKLGSLAAIVGGTALLVGLAIVIGQVAVAQADDTKKPPTPSTPKTAPSLAGKVVFVDIEDAINGYKKTKELKDKLQKEYSDKKKEYEEAVKKIAEDADELQLLSAQSKEYKAKQRDLRLRALTNEMDKKIVEEGTDEGLGSLYKEVYGTIRTTLATMAQAEGWAAVLVVNRKDLQASGEKGVTAAIAARTAIWFDPATDVTDRLLEKLNQ